MVSLINMCTQLCIHTSTQQRHIHMYVHAYIYTQYTTKTHTYIHAYIHTVHNKDTYIHTYMRIYTHSTQQRHIHTYMHIYTHSTQQRHIHTYIHACVYTHTVHNKDTYMCTHVLYTGIHIHTSSVIRTSGKIPIVQCRKLNVRHSSYLPQERWLYSR